MEKEHSAVVLAETEFAERMARRQQGPAGVFQHATRLAQLRKQPAALNKELQVSKGESMAVLEEAAGELLDRQSLGQRGKVTPQDLHNAAHLFERQVALPPFNTTHVTAVNPGGEGKRFLRKSFGLSRHANPLAKLSQGRVFSQHLPVFGNAVFSSTAYKPHFGLRSIAIGIKARLAIKRQKT